MDVAERSFALITDSDLKRLVPLVLSKLKEAFARTEVAALYQGRLRALTLCQGASQHYIDRCNGVKDIDVWSFFEGGLAKPFPVRSVWNADFGASHLGRSADDLGYSGRRIDIMGRSIPMAPNEPVGIAIQKWLKGGSTSGWYISKRPVIGLHPEGLFGRKLWMPTNG